MIACQSIAALPAALIHPSGMGSPQACDRHRMFLLRMLGTGFAGLAVAPFFLAFNGAPSLPQATIFGLALTPLGALAMVLKTGRLGAGHLVCAVALLATGVAAAITGQASLGCAAAWMVAAQAEGLLSFNRRILTFVAALSLLAFGGLIVLAVLGRLPSAAPRGDILAGAALAQAVAAVTCGLDLRRRLERAERLQLERADALLRTAGDLFVSYEAGGTVAAIDPACLELLGLPPVDLIGRGLFEHVHVADRPLFLKAVADAAHGSETIVVTFRLRAARADTEGAPATTFLWMEMRAKRLHAGVVSFLRDVTAHRRNEADLNAARQAAEEASRSKDNFLANMSHELRTPLNAIIGFSEMLASSELRPRDLAKQTEYAGIINQSGQHLLAVVNSILDMSKIQSGTFSISPEPFLVGPLIDSCCDIVTLKAQEGGIEIVRASTGGVDSIVGDRRACKQIVINLLSNAVKFTPRHGRVTVATRPDGNSLSICVGDTGIGIGADDLGRLGDPFFQARSALDRPYEGTGLGLSVVRGLVGLHGGTIAVESEPGRGQASPFACRSTAALSRRPRARPPSKSSLAVGRPIGRVPRCLRPG